MRKEAHPKGAPLIESIRVGDRQAKRYTGKGAEFPLGEELIKSRTLTEKEAGFDGLEPSFKEIYVMESNLGVSTFMKITPDGKIIKVIVLSDEAYLEEGSIPLNTPNDELLKIKLSVQTAKGKIVVIPNHVSNSPQSLDLFREEDTVEAEFDMYLAEARHFQQPL